MNKAIYSLLAVAIMVSFMLTSCSSKKSGNETKKDTTSKKELPKETIKEVDTKNTLLEGNWVSTDDPNSEIQVKGNDWIEIYKGEKPESTKFATGDSCLANDKAKTNPKGKYVTVFDKDDSRCFYIVNVNDTKLELSYVGSGNTLTYKKKK